MWPCVARPLHRFPQTVDNHFRQKGELHIFKIVLAALAVVVQYPPKISSSFLLSLSHPAFHSPWCVGASVDHHIPGLLRTLRPPSSIESVSQDLFVQPYPRPDLCDVHLLVGMSACPPQTCLFRFQIPSLRLLDQILHHLPHVRL